MSPGSAIFHRPELAKKFAEKIINVSPTSAASSGIFVAAPRRTGKTTFMRQDLAPTLSGMGHLVIYVDLWTDKSVNPNTHIVQAITKELAKHEAAIVRLAKSFGVGGGKVGGVEFSLDRVGVGKDVSLPAALTALSDTTERLIILIIDEAQHAITTSEGADAMFSLKAARDELNSSAHFGLRIVCTGSNRDKLAMLRNSKEQAFFGAPLVPMPSLNMEYVRWFCDNTKDLPTELDPEMIWSLFQRSGNRPEILNAAADVLRLDFELEAKDVSSRFAAQVEAEIQLSDAESMRVVHSLTPIQRAVLIVMAAGAERYAPFEAATISKYALAAMNAGEINIQPDIAGVQQALISLQQQGLIWRAARGVYSIEDSSLVAQLEKTGLFAGLYNA